ncbi:MAG: hypothetical protein HKN68_00255 [Saprospiraceae bacterium]|nr:hypothetical protein [Saprospiraceae bacterium]
MGVRKNVKHLDSTERENFVRSCVLMKADIVNPGDPVNNQYSKWDEFVALHTMIQSGIAPGNVSVNFGHGGSPGTGAYSFLSWHREFLYRFEQQLQSYVAGVMLPYWDWTDPSSIMTDTFLGGNGTGATNVITQGYFAVNRPGTGGNATVLPGWWPGTLNGWSLPSAFGSTWQGGLRRSVGNVAGLPSSLAVAETLGLGTYHNFQKALESGDGLTEFDAQMHNGMHGWIGGSGGGFFGHMAHPAASPFDPFFYLHHCNIDRLWAMWQLDGHATEYPNAGGVNFHHRNDLMYPWVGAAAGYGTSSSLNSSIPMPDFSGEPGRRNVDTLDHRVAYNYTYDCIPIIGIGLDKTGSMNGMTPDPMVALAPDVSKWEAATRGVSLFLQDCETVQDSGTTYIHAGVQTFRSLGANDFDNVFAGSGYGLVKNGGTISRASFDALIAAHSPGGGTPLADALVSVKNTMVDAPFGNIPNDEQRYIAMLTDGKRTTGSLFNTIPNLSMSPTAIFGMGFGTGADVDYPTINTMVGKGVNLSTTQVFNGANAGTIDKFYTNALATAIGYTAIFDPLLELFPGEHTHLPFSATSAEDSFFITAQGFDFIDENWQYMLKGPDGTIHYTSMRHNHKHNHCNHCCPKPHITVRRSKGRLSLVIQRNNTSRKCWVGQWELMIMYKAKDLNGMLMPTIGELMFPVSGGPIRGNEFFNLLTRKGRRIPTRKVFTPAANGLDQRAVITNAEKGSACNNLVNIYARTNLKMEIGDPGVVQLGKPIEMGMSFHSTTGKISPSAGFIRMISPSIDYDNYLSRKEVDEIIAKNERSRKPARKYDTAVILAKRLRKFENSQLIHDQELPFKLSKENTIIIENDNTKYRGAYHLGILVTGEYTPDYKDMTDHCCGNHDHNKPETFTRLINHTITVE